MEGCQLRAPFPQQSQKRGLGMVGSSGRAGNHPTIGRSCASGSLPGTISHTFCQDHCGSCYLVWCHQGECTVSLPGLFVCVCDRDGGGDEGRQVLALETILTLGIQAAPLNLDPFLPSQNAHFKSLQALGLAPWTLAVGSERGQHSSLLCSLGRWPAWEPGVLKNKDPTVSTRRP